MGCAVRSLVDLSSFDRRGAVVDVRDVRPGTSRRACWSCGAFAGCSVPVDLAVPAVLAYQVVSRWLHAAARALGYLCLRDPRLQRGALS